jgi:hypothetical protein
MKNKIISVLAVLLSISLILVLTRIFLIDWVVVQTGTDRHAPDVPDGEWFFVCLVCAVGPGDYVIIEVDNQLLVEQILSIVSIDQTVTLTSPQGVEITRPVSNIKGIILR